MATIWLEGRYGKVSNLAYNGKEPKKTIHETTRNGTKESLFFVKLGVTSWIVGLIFPAGESSSRPAPKTEGQEKVELLFLSERLGTPRRNLSALFLLALISFFVITGTLSVRAQSGIQKLPEVRREFRAVWIATVDNIDWPSKRGLAPERQREELIRILDLAQGLKLNAVVLQVRPQCDALYSSRIEPWSEYLTGEMGKAPVPFYDPLEFAIKEAHARGILVHAWFNPFRALHPSASKPPSANHISQLSFRLAKTYGRYIWLDPGESEVQDYSLKVVLDVVRRYDIDGVHFDDYFYPYAEKGVDGKPIPFPDKPSWSKYVASGGQLSRSNWRRQNVDSFIRRVSQSVKKIKPHVLFGISPFGIWQPLPEAGVKGFNSYEGLYADSRKWLREGWIDYLSPQLYWPIKPREQSYTTLLDWWSGQNVRKRHLWPGNAAYRIGDKLSAQEIEDQVIATRQRLGSAGNIFFSMKSFLNNLGDLNGRLKRGLYSQPALIPTTPWIGGSKPSSPAVTITKNPTTGSVELRWSDREAKRAFLWVVNVRKGEGWETMVFPQSMNRYVLPRGNSTAIVAVSAVDRLGNESSPKILKW
jgi:uncharacterized lipoprotein YddW (UPF0748 family)